MGCTKDEMAEPSWRSPTGMGIGGDGGGGRSALPDLEERRSMSVREQGALYEYACLWAEDQRAAWRLA